MWGMTVKTIIMLLEVVRRGGAAVTDAAKLFLRRRELEVATLISRASIPYRLMAGGAALHSKLLRSKGPM